VRFNNGYPPDETIEKDSLGDTVAFAEADDWCEGCDLGIEDEQSET